MFWFHKKIVSIHILIIICLLSGKIAFAAGNTLSGVGGNHRQSSLLFNAFFLLFRLPSSRLMDILSLIQFDNLFWNGVVKLWKLYADHW